MNTLLFFPWLKIESGFTVGDFELAPYVRGVKPFGKDSRQQEQVDRILSVYRVRGENPIEKATILRYKNKDPLAKLDEEEISAAFVFGELIAISGLSAREFFWPGAFQYCNRDLFQLRVVSFEGEIQGLTVRNRRRDGSTLNHVSLDAYRVHKPHHVADPIQVQFDIELLGSLLEIQSEASVETWGRYYESIVNFNQANRETNKTPPHIEILFTSAAFERLLGLAGGNEANLAYSFVDTLEPGEDLPLGSCDRLTEEQINERGADTVRELWIRDFYRLRGDLAHGQVDSSYPSIWSIDEHLLLSSFIYPLLLKSCLEQSYYHGISDYDQTNINIFESLCCASTYGPVETEYGEVYAWNQIKSNAMLSQIFRDGGTLIEGDDSVDD